MAYRLKYSDYSTTEGPPDPAAWVGPPGPPGPPGPQGPPGSMSGSTLTGPMYFTATGSTASRSLQDRAADHANILDFGGKADFNGTTGTDNAAAFAAAQATSKCVYIPTGNYFFASTPATATTALVVRGDGRWLTSLIFGTGATNGLVASLASYRQTTSITGLTIATLGNETGAAIKVSYPDADASLYPYADHLVIRDVTISG